MSRPRFGETVGVDSGGARGLAASLDDVEALLAAQSGRVQSLLDEAGIASSVPLTIRSAGRTCGGVAADLRTRIGVIPVSGSEHLRHARAVHRPRMA